MSSIKEFVQSARDLIRDLEELQKNHSREFTAPQAELLYNLRMAIAKYDHDKFLERPTPPKLF